MISKKEIDHIAKLARIKLTEAEEEKFSGELSSILDYIDKLNKVDTKKITPVSQVTGLENMERKDEPSERNTGLRNKILKQAPDSERYYYKVPKIFE
jgi:aspartyl-tRNA(Asn)/glutamyl-tRNA(Gln) amidotransferase subunit C